MKLSRLAMVSRMADERRLLLQQIAIVEQPHDPLNVLEPQYRIIIAGARQDDAIHALVRPVLVTELRARIAVLDKDLAALGVTPDD